MTTWDAAILDCQDTTQDYTATSLAFFKRQLNKGYKVILSTLGRSITEKTATSPTVASQQWYQTPYDYNTLKSIAVTVGSRTYPLEEEPSQDNWNNYNQITRLSNIPSRFFVRPNFGYGGTEVGIWPIPSSAGNTITLVYEGMEQDMSQTAYTTGTVSVTLGSATVTGVGTTFSANMVGRYFQITSNTGDGLYYQVASYTSPTSITLRNVYQGATVSTVNYQIAQAFSLPDEVQILPIFYALAWYYKMKIKNEQYEENMALFRDGRDEAKRNYDSNSRSASLPDRSRSGSGGALYPGWFPLTIQG